MMTVVPLEPDNAGLLDRTLLYLMQQEAVHCLQIGLLLPLANGNVTDAEWWLALDGGVIAGVASRTAPHNLVISSIAVDEAIPVFVESLAAIYPGLPGVIGPKPWSLRFAEGWASFRGIGQHLEMNEAVYECTEVFFPETMTGSARFANETDIGWMAPWIDRFFSDAGMPREGADSEDFVRRRLRDGGFVLWLDKSGQVVSLAGFANPTPSGIRVGPVYTPSELRGLGYGVAVSAAVTQHLLDSDRSSVYLFADLGNPIANHVYQKIGYQAVADYGVYQFDVSDDADTDDGNTEYV